jgi:hypothetical protein
MEGHSNVVGRDDYSGIRCCICSGPCLFRCSIHSQLSKKGAAHPVSNPVTALFAMAQWVKTNAPPAKGGALQSKIST